MIPILAAVVGTFVVTTAGHVWLARYYLRLGWQLCADDRALDPGDTTGSLDAVAAESGVGESSGRHARLARADDASTEVLPAVTA